MIQSLKLINFRNFEEKLIRFESEKNFIIGENGKGKTNILEALSLLGNNSLTHIDFENLVKSGEDFFFIECEYDTGSVVSLSFDKEKKTKNYRVNGKNTTKKKFLHETHKCCIFSPIIMNMMYLSPSLRRDFLDEVLSNSFNEYSLYLKEYKKIVRQRNATLKQIHEGKCPKSEIEFWNEKFISYAENIYNYRIKLIDFFKENIESSKEYFSNKVDEIEFSYISKIDFSHISNSIKTYLDENFERDILLGKTPIGPHVDDFDVLVDGISMTQFASRGETKSVILWLKLLETVFIEKMQGEKPILIIDDLLSELDTIHKDMYTKKIKYYQTIISSIDPVEAGNIITLK